MTSPEIQAGIDEDTELYWYFEEFSYMGSNGQVQRCGAGEGGAVGLSCWDEFPIEMLREFNVDSSILGLGADERIEVCWDEGPGAEPIRRTLVIGDKLWSLSYGSLQSNLLADLSRTQRLSLN